MITASKIELAKRCPGALALPQTRHSTDEAEEGTERHAEYEDRIKAGDIPEALARRWPDLKWLAEVKFAYDFVAKTGRIIGYGTDRDYSSATLTEIPGTADAIGYAPGKIVVVDFKSFDPNVPRAKENPQLHIAALAFARSFDLWEADVAIHHEVRPFDVAELARWDLENFADEVRAIFEESARVRRDVRNGAEPTLNIGKWCRWCDAFFDCPKQKALRVDAETGAIALRVETMIPFSDDDEAVRAYELLKSIGMLQKRLRSALIQRSKERPIPLGNGRVYGPHPTEGQRKIDGDIGYAVLRERFGQEVADAAVKREISQASIERALKPVTRKGELSSTKEAVLKDIDARKGIKRSTSIEIEEYEPQPLLKVVNE